MHLSKYYYFYVIWSNYAYFGQKCNHMINFQKNNVHIHDQRKILSNMACLHSHVHWIKQFRILRDKPLFGGESAVCRVLGKRYFAVKKVEFRRHDPSMFHKQQYFLTNMMQTAHQYLLGQRWDDFKKNQYLSVDHT